MELAEKKGVFPYYDKSIYKNLGIRVRNATTTTIAPTGTLSIIAGVSSGIEPLFAISYIRNVMDNDELVEVNPVFKQVAKEEGFYSDELMRRDLTRYRPDWHVRMQAAFQKSKTVNLRNEATRKDVADAFWLAYKTNCKGITGT